MSYSNFTNPESKSTNEFSKQIDTLSNKLQAIYDFATDLGKPALPGMRFWKQGDAVIAENLDTLATLVTKGDFGTSAKVFFANKTETTSDEQEKIDKQLDELSKKATVLSELFTKDTQELQLAKSKAPIYSIKHNQNALQKLAIIAGKINEYKDENKKSSYQPPSKV